MVALAFREKRFATHGKFGRNDSLEIALMLLGMNTK